MSRELVHRYQVNWSWNSDTEEWLRNLCIGYTLNFPCGMSQIGDVRADIDPNMKPTLIADLKKPLEYFKPLSFDTILCDPPYAMYCHPSWASNLSKVTRKRIIFATPCMAIYLGQTRWKKSIYAEDYGKKFMRLYQVFDRLDGQLS